MSVILRDVSLSCCKAPFVRTGIRLHLACKDLEESCLRKLVRSNKSNFIFTVEDKGDVVENFYAVDCLCKTFNCKNFVTDLTERAEVDVRIFSAGRSDLVKLDLLKSTFSGSRLFGLGSVRGEPLDEFLQLLDLLFLLLVRFLQLADHQLR